MEEARQAYTQATDLAPKYVKALINAQRLKKVASVGAGEVEDEAGTVEVEP